MGREPGRTGVVSQREAEVSPVCVDHVENRVLTVSPDGLFCGDKLRQREIG